MQGDKALCVQPGELVVRVDPRYFRTAEVETLIGEPIYAHEKSGWQPTVTAQEP